MKYLLLVVGFFVLTGCTPWRPTTVTPVSAPRPISTATVHSQGFQTTRVTNTPREIVATNQVTGVEVSAVIAMDQSGQPFWSDINRRGPSFIYSPSLRLNDNLTVTIVSVDTSKRQVTLQFGGPQPYEIYFGPAHFGTS